MIPFVAVVSLRNQESRTFRLWIPLVLIWLLLLPIAILLPGHEHRSVVGPEEVQRLVEVD